MYLIVPSSLVAEACDSPFPPLSGNHCPASTWMGVLHLLLSPQRGFSTAIIWGVPSFIESQFFDSYIVLFDMSLQKKQNKTPKTNNKKPPKTCKLFCFYPSSTKEAFRLSRGAWDRESSVITSSKKPTSSFRSSSYRGKILTINSQLSRTKCHNSLSLIRKDYHILGRATLKAIFCKQSGL